MKILCVIDHFGSGGAQRQMVNLACGLKARGHHVEMFIYYPESDFFRSNVEKAGISIQEVRKKNRFSFKVLLGLMHLIKNRHYDGIISFLKTPCVYAELASFANFRTKLIVSERSSHHNDNNRIFSLFCRLMHNRADFVVSNSFYHTAWLGRYNWLKGKLKTIYNGYPIQNLYSHKTIDFKSPDFLVIGRISAQKNGATLVEALHCFYSKHGYVPTVNWAGRLETSESGLRCSNKIFELLDKYPEVKAKWTFLGERDDIPQLLEQHSCLVLPSLHEGLPNVVCEAFIAGRPVLASNVCDHPVLVEEGERGFLFDPLDPQSIADAIEHFISLNQDEWHHLSSNARKYAEENLSIERMVREYESLLLK
jgi:glycosyltransferase involved in cell wall biosynthesis